MTTTTSVDPAAIPQLRALPLSRIRVEHGFNPRTDVESAELEQLADSIRLKGILQPVRVAPADDSGDYKLLAGGRRIAAAALAGLMEVPAIIAPAGSDCDGLDDALIENMSRVDLTPIEEAKGIQRLLDAGLTRTGVAERLSKPRRFVTERLQLLELPEALHDRIDAGVIPLGAIKPLRTLARIQPELAILAVTRIERAMADEQYDPWPTWAQLSEDPIYVVTAHEEGHYDELAALGIYESRHGYPIERFTLEPKADKQLAQLCELLDRQPSDLRVRFEGDLLESARSLKALVSTANNWQHLIVGQDIADQLAADTITATLKQARERRKRETKAAAERNPASPAPAGSSGGGAAVEPELTPEQREAAEQEQRRAQREQDKRDRAAAIAYNEQLGAAVVKQLSRVKVDERVLKILTTVDLHGNLSQVAARGARYGFAGWMVERTTAAGKTKQDYAEQHEALPKARDYLAGASTPGDYAGRCVALIVMAYLADQRAVAQSRRVGSSLHFGDSGLPWAGEVRDLLEDLAIEKLPEPLTVQLRERQAALAELDKRVKRIESIEPEAELDRLVELARTADQRPGETYSLGGMRFRIEQLVNDEKRRRAELAAAAAEPGAETLAVSEEEQPVGESPAPVVAAVDGVDAEDVSSSAERDVAQDADLAVAA